MGLSKSTLDALLLEVLFGTKENTETEVLFISAHKNKEAPPTWDLSPFKDKYIGVLCETPSQAKEFLSACKENKLTWLGGMPINNIFSWREYENKTVYVFAEGGIIHLPREEFLLLSRSLFTFGEFTKMCKT